MVHDETTNCYLRNPEKLLTVTKDKTEPGMNVTTDYTGSQQMPIQRYIEAQRKRIFSEDTNKTISSAVRMERPRITIGQMPDEPAHGGRLAQTYQAGRGGSYAALWWQSGKHLLALAHNGEGQIPRT